MAKREKRGLGRGLSALMADMDAKPSSSGTTADNATSIPIDLINPNPDQPRRHFAPEALSELAASIKQKGIIQPLILRSDPDKSGQYQIVAGERRWRAAQEAQLHEVPALVREFDDTEVLEVAIIENIQRADLNALEEALGYKQLLERFGHTQDQLASAMGKSRSYVANMIRLLSLPEDVQHMLQSGELTAGHARALITSDNASEQARQIVQKGLSVREAEKLAKSQRAPKRDGGKPQKDADTLALEGSLSAALKMPISIDHNTDTGAGKVSIRYKDLGELDDLVQVLGG